LAATAPAPARAPTVVLSRYDTGEHALFGDDRVVFTRGDVQITEAEMITMGDLYARPEDMYQADLDELRTLVRLVREDRDAYLGKAGAAHVSNDQWERATPHGPHRQKSFLELADENATHFAPSSHGHMWDWHTARDHKAEFQRIHKQALDMAHAATTQDELQKALAFNAFAGHFLTDAFAAGHMVPKQDIIERAERAFTRMDTWGWLVKENAFSRRVAETVLADPRARALRQYWIRIVNWHEMSAEHLSELLYAFAHDDTYKSKFYNTFVKVVHDELNKTGVEVTNAHKDGPWTVHGDERLLPAGTHANAARDLYANSMTLKVGHQAVQESAANALAAYFTPGRIDYQANFDRVWAYAPRPTAAGWQHINDVQDRLLDPSRPEAVKAFAEVVLAHVDLLIRTLNDPKVDRLESDDEVHGRVGKPM
jgi:hypothetical protein